MNLSVNKANLYGIAGSAIFSTLLFLMLWFVVFPVMKTTEEEGLIVSFGDSPDGGGTIPTATLAGSPKVAISTLKAASIPAEAPSKPLNTGIQSIHDASIRQNEQSVYMEQQKQKAKKEQEIIKQQQINSERIAAEQKAREQGTINKVNSTMKGLFGNSNSPGNGNGTGTGSGTGSGHQGNPLGNGFSGGHSWSLTGRTLEGTISSPYYSKDIEGCITVNIRVDESGRVVSCSIGSPTNIPDADMRNAALSAASRTRFSSGNGIATGSITYNFRLK